MPIVNALVDPTNIYVYSLSQKEKHNESMHRQERKLFCRMFIYLAKKPRYIDVT